MSGQDTEPGATFFQVYGSRGIEEFAHSFVAVPLTEWLMASYEAKVRQLKRFLKSAKEGLSSRRRLCRSLAAMSTLEMRGSKPVQGTGSASLAYCDARAVMYRSSTSQHKKT
jgi:hypothetical protein